MKNGVHAAPPTLQTRAAGVLLHPTSLSNRYPIGDLGPAAYAFVDFMATAGLRWWQMLPVGPVGAGNSPYQAHSAFAGNALLISPDFLARAKWLKKRDLQAGSFKISSRVDFKRARSFKDQLLRRAYDHFQKRANPREHRAFETFQEAQDWWLRDYTFFRVACAAQNEEAWTRWPKALRLRFPKTLAQLQKKHGRELRFFAFEEWVFTQQWKALRAYAANRGIGLLGDIPIFMGALSCDVWARRDIFQLRANGQPRVVSGVAPDYFAKTGQRWGNPHYRWDTLKQQRYRWWIDRFKKNFTYFDAVRLDHFIGFIRFYEIPGDAPTAEKGRYKKGPGADFFRAVIKALALNPNPPFIAEDLGLVTPEVKRIRDQFHLPGMKVLQFAFGTDPEAKNYQPHAYPPNAVAYTGTHDNDTTVGWFRDPARTTEEKSFALRYLNNPGHDIHWAMIRAVFASSANTAVTPMQDFLGLDSRARMNRPGTAEANWNWRLTPGALTRALSQRIRLLSETYGRI